MFTDTFTVSFYDSLTDMFKTGVHTMNQETFLDLHQSMIAKMHDICKRKAHDYNPSDDMFATFRLCETLGISTTEAGILTRMTDKLSRAANLIGKGDALVGDESIQDTLLDLANYSIILSIYLAYGTLERHE